MNTIDFNAVGIAGDWHANKGWAHLALKTFQLADIKHVLHVGDFGVWPGNSGQKYLYRVNKWLNQYEITLYVTLGNHEDYVQVASFTPHPTMEGFVYNPDYPNILFATRGARWVWNNTSFVSLGGANSIDYAGRTEGLNWWKEERISLGDVYNTVAGGYADVMIAHDCPAGVDIFGSHRDAGAGWRPAEIKYASESRVMLRQAVDGVKPELLFHGHYHMKLDLITLLNDGVNDYQLRSIGLDMDATLDNMGVLVLPDKSFTWLPFTGEAKRAVLAGE